MQVLPKLTYCPKCGHEPLPKDQSLPAACPACGVILAKVAQLSLERADRNTAEEMQPKSLLHRRDDDVTGDEPSRLKVILLNPTASVDPVVFWPCAVLWVLFAIWGVNLISQDYRTGEIGASFLHRPLLIFHEAGHVIFRLFGDWVMILGGSLGQLAMPAILGGALLIRNRDPFGASVGLWFFGVSLLDIAPYMYDALHPQLMLLSGTTGEDGGHDWIYLFSSVGLLGKAQFIGGFTHKIGALTVLVSIAWGGWVLRLQHGRLK
jgi:hypothetical protein